MSGGNLEFEQLPSDAASLIDDLCDRFEQDWQSVLARQASSGSEAARPELPSIEAVLVNLSSRVASQVASPGSLTVAPAFVSVLLRELVVLDVQYRQKAGLDCSADDYAQRFSTLSTAWLTHVVQPTLRESPILPDLSEPSLDRMVGQITEYRIDREIGRGGMGVVYQAHDRQLDRPVAIKLLLPEFLRDATRLPRFYREARSVSAINHPNICTIYAIRECQGLPYLVLEWIEGETLRARLRGGAEPLTLLSALLQVAQALAVTHQRGIVHRDIKPENVMLRPDGLVKVLDFGLARLAEGNAAPGEPPLLDTHLGMMLGTVPYMSPEQARGDRVDCESDIFSLGTMMYEVITGRHPFLAATSPATLCAIVSVDPIEPRQRVTSIDPSLEHLVLTMLAKDVAQRPRATEVVAQLQAILAKATTGDSPAIPTPSGDSVTGQVPAGGPTVGRDRQRLAIQQACIQAMAGRGGICAVSGEPGIGKTTVVVDSLTTLVVDQKITVAEGRCSERLAGSEAYLPVLDALESLLRGPAHRETRRCLEQYAPTWYAQVVSSVGGHAPMTPSQERIKREFRSFVEALSRQRPLVLFLDDIHWSDHSTIDLLSYLSRDLQRIPLVVIAVFRPTDLVLYNHPFHSLKLDLQARGICTEITLDLLSSQDVADYVQQAFPGHVFPAGFTDLLHERTEGNPLFLMSLLRFLQEREAIGQSGHTWQLTRTIDDILSEIPTSVHSMIEKKLSLVDAEDQRLLCAASVQGYEFDAAVVALGLGIDLIDVEERLARLAQIHGLVRELRSRDFPNGTPSSRLQFVHVLYQNVLFNSLVPARRRALSASVARALCQLHGDRSAAIASELALLWEAAREWERAAECFNAAAQHAMQLFGYREAHQLAERGLQLVMKLPESAERDQRALQLHATLGAPLVAMKGYAAQEILDTQRHVYELSKGLGNYDLQVRATRQLHSYQLLSGDVRESYEQARLFLEEALQRQNRQAIVEARNCHGLSLVHLGRVEESLEEFREALRTCDSHTAKLLESMYAINPIIRAKAAMAWGEWFVGRSTHALELLDEARALCHTGGPSFTLVHVQFISAFVHQLRWELDLSQGMIDQVLEHSEQQGFKFYLALGKIWQGWLNAHLGNSTQGLQQLVAGWELGQAMFSRACEPFVFVMKADIMRLLNLPQEGLLAIASAMQSAEETGQSLYEPEILRLKGELLLQQSRNTPHADRVPDDAAACFEQGYQIAARRGLSAWTLRIAISRYRYSQSPATRADLSAAYEAICHGGETGDTRLARELLDGTRMVDRPPAS